MSRPVRQLRPRAPVNYQVDEVSDMDDESEFDTGTDDELQVDTEKTFEFFDLPQELRDMVYSEALVHPHGVHLWGVMVSGVQDTVVLDPSRYMKTQLSTNLMATCKQVYYEARLVAYRQPFIFNDPQVVHSFLVNLKPSTIGLLKDITINIMRYTRTNNNALLSGLRDAMSLTTFRLGGRVTGSEFQFSRSDHRVGVEIAKKFYSDASYFIIPFVASHGIDTLLQVVKFHTSDLQGNEYSVRHGRPMTEARKDTIMESVKTQLLKLLEEKRKSSRCR